MYLQVLKLTCSEALHARCFNSFTSIVFWQQPLWQGSACYGVERPCSRSHAMALPSQAARRGCTQVVVHTVVLALSQLGRPAYAELSSCAAFAFLPSSCTSSVCWHSGPKIQFSNSCSTPLLG
jgi:hypothetical protein